MFSRAVSSFVTETLAKWYRKKALKVVDISGAVIGNSAKSGAAAALIDNVLGKSVLESIIIGDRLKLDLSPAVATAKTVAGVGNAAAATSEGPEPALELEAVVRRLDGSNKDIECGGARVIAWWLENTAAGQACQELDISKNKIKSEAAKALAIAVKNSKSLKCLVVGKYGTHVPANSAVKQLTLEHQDLEAEELIVAGAAVATMKAVEVVHMSCGSNAVASEPMTQLLKGLGRGGLSVVELDVSECRLTCKSMDALADVINNKALTTLVLDRNAIWGTLSESFAAMAPDSSAKDDGIATMLTALANSTTLTKLSLGYTGIGPESVAQLGARLPASILHLNLSGCPLTGAKCNNDGFWTSPEENDGNTVGLKALFERLATTCTGLQRLEVSDCHLRDVSAEHIAAELLMKHASLAEIDFSRNEGVGYDGAKACAEAITTGCKQLQTIVVGKHSTSIAVNDTEKKHTKLPDLGAAGFGPAEMRLIAAAMKTMPTLREVDLSKTTIGRAGKVMVEALHTLKYLSTVTIGKSKIIPLKQTFGPKFLWDEEDDAEGTDQTTGLAGLQSKARLAEAAVIKKDLMTKAAIRRQQVIPDPFYEREEYEAAVSAATCLQQLLRRRLVEHWMKVNRDVVKAERNFEATARAQVKAALIVQRCSRGYSARKRDEWQKHATARKQLKACVLMQRHIRGYQARMSQRAWSVRFLSAEEEDRRKKAVTAAQGARSLISDVKKLGTASPRRTSKAVHTAAKIMQQAARSPDNVALRMFDPEYL